MIARAALSAGPDAPFEILDVELDSPQAHETLVRIEASGVCHTDAWARTLFPQAVLGHEGVGTVLEVGAHVSEVEPGDRVVISYPSCGACRRCLTGSPYHCESILQLLFAGARPDGSPTIRVGGAPVASAFFQQSSFGTAALAPARSLVKVDGDLPVEVLAALPCGVQTGAGAVLNVFRASPGESLAVFGAGAVGLAAVMAGRIAGVAPLVAVDIDDGRLQRASELGATHAFRAEEAAAGALRRVAPRGFDFVLDTSAVDSAWHAATDSLAIGGTFGIVTTPGHDDTYTFPPSKFFAPLATLRSIHQGHSVPRVFLPRLIDWYREGRFPVDTLVEVFDLDRIDEAFHASASGRVVKPILRIA